MAILRIAVGLRKNGEHHESAAKEGTFTHPDPKVVVIMSILQRQPAGIVFVHSGTFCEKALQLIRIVSLAQQRL